jgi:hypothetical protein
MSNREINGIGSSTVGEIFGTGFSREGEKRAGYGWTT